jgi:DNA polymerase III delta subunit
MESLKLAVFTTQILQCFQETKKRICSEIIQLSNQNNLKCKTSDLDKISYLYSELMLETQSESQFLEFVNHYPDKITSNELDNWRLFYIQFRDLRF